MIFPLLLPAETACTKAPLLYPVGQKFQMKSEDSHRKFLRESFFVFVFQIRLRPAYAAGAVGSFTFSSEL